MDSDYYAEEFRLLNSNEPKQFKDKQMQISIISTSIETKPTARGSYQQLEVVYKNLTFQGKVESKKLMSFGAGAAAFKALSESSSGGVYDITVVKNDKGFNDWTAASMAVPGAAAAAGQAAQGGMIGKPNTTPKSTYETPEERAQRQILIVRQSSVSSACTALGVGAKSPPKVEDVITYAKSLEAYVFGVEDTGPTGFNDLPNFDAEVN